MKPILPNKILINTKHSYQNFRKNQTKIGLKLEINRDEDYWSRPNLHTQIQRLTQLLKIFKTLKYAQKIDLSSLILYSQNLYFSKMIYFAK